MRVFPIHRAFRPRLPLPFAMPALILAALPAACRPPEPTMHMVQADIAGTAVSLTMPEGLVAIPAPSGIAIRPTGAETSRRIHEMTLTRAAGKPVVPFDQSRGVGANAVRYGVKRAEGGSGGEEAILIAERRCGAVTLRLRLDTQADEDGAIDLDPALEILAGARCAAAG